MMSAEFDVIIVGSGPAGVSAAFPLLDAGLKVLLVDGGRTPRLNPPSQPFLRARATAPDQWKWMIGEDFYSLTRRAAISPKLRAPTQRFVFEGFEAANRVEPTNFIALGSMAAGGLSNAWGGGVATLSRAELKDYPFEPDELSASYARVARRIGLSGAGQDDLTDYAGVDAWAEPPLPLDSLQSLLFVRYSKRIRPKNSDFRMGRSRLAALSVSRGDRLACDNSGTCLWGCHRRSLYSATEDLRALRMLPNMTYWPGFTVEHVGSEPGGAFVRGRGPQGARQISAHKVLLGAGTLASTRLAAHALQLDGPIPLQSCPVAAYILWAPSRLGQAHEPATGLGQLSFVLKVNHDVRGHGALFNVSGLPMSEFSRFMPFRKRIGVDVLSWIMSSCAVGNIFLPGTSTRASARLRADGAISFDGCYAESTSNLMKIVERKLRSQFLSLGALLLPGGFQIGSPGGDIHYSATFPMRATPMIGESDAIGEVRGLAGVHMIDAAALPSLPAKPHTLTVMANADRIGSILAEQLRSPQ